ncbi:MAG: hypothetical protein JXB32_05155 [Deltaproteobacteria bacterium]|nr:hypothetical protein [Deltaproteobacteria bacterium]
MPNAVRCPGRPLVRRLAGRSPVAALVAALSAALFAAPAAAAPPTWPTAWEVWTDGFEGPGLDDHWEDQGEGRISIRSDAAHVPSGSGLAVDLSGTGQAYLQRWHMTEWPPLEYPRDTYFRFAFRPNGATIPAGASAALLRVHDSDWNLMVGLRLTQDAEGYRVALELPDGSVDTTSFTLDDDWHTLVVGVRPNDWVGLWVDEQPPRLVEGVEHSADFVQVLLLGKPDGNWSGPTPSGTVHFDDLTLLFGAYPELWVDPAGGADTSEGNTAGAPLRTLALAAKLSSPGTTVHLVPGDYRESVVLPVDGTAERPIRFVADGGRGSARVLGSEPATSVTWSRLTDPAEIDLPSGVDLGTAMIWKADLSVYALEAPPSFVVLRGAGGSVVRLTAAREPDERIDTPWKHHEFWWAAEGGSAVTTCEPRDEPECDEPQRSDRWLIDHHDDPEPSGIEPGSLAALGDVTGATIFVKDNWSGHYLFRRRVAENPEPGRVRLEAFPDAYTEGCWFDHDPANPALGWHSKYFVEGLAKLLDTPGEWYFDAATGTLYVWTPDGRSPAELGLEFSVRDVGIDLSQRSYVELRDLDVLLFDETGIEVSNGGETDRSHGLLLAGLDVGWVRYGLELAQEAARGSPAGVQIRRFTLRDSVFHDIDTVAVSHWAGSGEDFVRPGITDVRIVHNEFARIGFRENERGGVGLSFGRADHFLFEGNHVHDVAHCGVHFSQGQTVPGNRGYDLAPDEVLTGDILVRGNLIERSVQNATDAGGLKFWGATRDRSHVFRDVLVVGNVSRDSIGWAWVSQRRDNWTYFGRGGMGYYIDFAGGISFFRNISWNNGLAGFMASGSWIDQPVVLANNTIAGSPLGYTMGTRGAFADATVGLDAVNTIFLHLHRFAYSVGQDEILAGRVQLDHDLFHDCGFETWEHHTPGLMAGHVDGSGYRELPDLADVQALGFEADGRVEDPRLADFDPAMEWPDFRPTAASVAAVDTGGPLPASLVALLEKLGLTDGRHGAALDRGALEFDADHPDAPFALEVGPGDGTATIVTPWDDGYEDPPVPPPDEGGDSGCGCRAVGGSCVPGWWLAALVGLAVLRWGRRRSAR